MVLLRTRLTSSGTLRKKLAEKKVLLGPEGTLEAIDGNFDSTAEDFDCDLASTGKCGHHIAQYGRNVSLSVTYDRSACKEFGRHPSIDFTQYERNVSIDTFEKLLTFPCQSTPSPFPLPLSPNHPIPTLASY
jgi:hypothetical protein